MGQDLLVSGGITNVQEVFDSIAPFIDELVLGNPINAWMRRVNLAVLHRSFPSGSCLLDLGCGTGVEALSLAKKGCRIFAFDISGGMVARAKERVAAEGLESRVTTATGRISDLPQVLSSSPWKQFDGAYANFSLTYEDSLENVAKLLSRVLAEDAHFICTLPNRIVLSELLIYGLQLRFARVLWRLEVPLIMDVHGHPMEIRTYFPRSVVRAFSPYFEVEGLQGVPVALPPVYLHSQYRRLGSGQRLLENLDRVVAKRYPWNSLGEHTLFRFRRSRS